ncbi:MAG: hypothetical protein M1294_10305 [Firmicutes bacterium]|jgi:hypothetical protein|uniref:Uncharacterized protein n=1 Tax=Sulfobacillus benefaciens TaxID=453960 RepID=A0A2T2X745_9FIRM|nr:hypothetical protein [Bacillota bacterium]PSR30323.1 MAG: hypothetical protein C7B43_06300 [Sulfobacillus benefaciens]
MNRSWFGYFVWTIGLCLLLVLGYRIQHYVSVMATRTFQNDTLWIEPPMLFVLGLYMAMPWVWKHSRHLNPERFLGTFVPLFLLSVYPIIAVASGWIIPWVTTYMTVYPMMPILAGMTLMMSGFDSRVGPRG